MLLASLLGYEQKFRIKKLITFHFTNKIKILNLSAQNFETLKSIISAVTQRLTINMSHRKTLDYIATALYLYAYGKIYITLCYIPY